MKLLVSLLSAVTRGAILVGDYPFSPSITVVYCYFAHIKTVNIICVLGWWRTSVFLVAFQVRDHIFQMQNFQCRVIYVIIPCEAFRLPPIRLRVCQLRRIDFTWWAKYWAEFDFADTTELGTWSQHCFCAIQRRFPSDWHPRCPCFHVCGRIFPSRRRSTDQNTGVSLNSWDLIRSRDLIRFYPSSDRMD